MSLEKLVQRSIERRLEFPTKEGIQREDVITNGTLG